ncbi:hypothetical protein PCC7424_2933 [Gloeothece citriformis PCC 7424]|uniref:Uncharacterized protein n=1 Tax=Gloeothece citriformis (strain PCC 7424) TaxID=65393 RepID=B7K9Y1_GLOC7|nr:hypothetical protein [Gloeothece citriformis]ACK71337.1 hypothetical protein PCC7424_2933 [Gloeothece citriformis PCC 7424]
MTNFRIQEKQKDLEVRLEKLKFLFSQIGQKIEQIYQQGDLSPVGCWIVRYQAKGQGGSYWYYKWQSHQAIFITKQGTKSYQKYIGKAGSPAFNQAVEMMMRRNLIEALQAVHHIIELGLLDLEEEASREN